MNIKRLGGRRFMAPAGAGSYGVRYHPSKARFEIKQPLPRHKRLGRQLGIKPRKDGSLWIPDYGILRKHIDGFEGPKPVHRSYMGGSMDAQYTDWIGPLRQQQKTNVLVQWNRRNGDRGRMQLRALLANDVGCGKSLEAIQLWNLAGRPDLTIVCPVSVKMVWPDEFKKWVGHMPDNIIVVNYERVMIDGWRAYKRPNQMLIVDEAHRLTNRDEQTKAERDTQAECIRQLARHASHVALLTATPARNHPEDIWGLLNVLDPVLYSSYWTWARAYFEVDRTDWGWEIGEHRDEAAYGRECGQWMTRATRAETFPDLDYSMQQVRIQMDDDLYQAYSDLLHDKEMLPITKLTMMRMVTSEAKMRWLDQYLHDAPKSACFSNFTSLFHIATPTSGKRADMRFKLQGGMSDTQRRNVVLSMWAEDESVPRHIIVNYKAGGEGIDLSCCKQAILVDLDYTSTGIEQAIGRLLRPKQTEDCVVVQVPHTGTFIDNYIYAMVVDKSVALLPLNTAEGATKLIDEMANASPQHRRLDSYGP